MLDIILPEKRKLPPVERQPLPPPGQKIRKMPKQLIDMRGPELVNNRLFHNQYGIRVSQIIFKYIVIFYYSVTLICSSNQVRN